MSKPTDMPQSPASAAPVAEPASFSFDEHAMPLVEQAIARYPEGRQASATIALLDFAQRQMKRQTGSAWLPRAAMDETARVLRLPPIRVYEIATFYTMFNTKPIGRYHLQVCTTTPCWLRGSDDVVKACRDVSGIERFGDTSADRTFTLTEVECLGACVNAPMIQINDGYYEDLDYDRTVALLRNLADGGALPVPGSTAGRHGSEPEGGRTTLLEGAAAGEDQAHA